MLLLIQHSNGNNVWERMKSYKEPFVEPRDKNNFADSLKLFYQRISDITQKGAILFAVCRGKASEGIDFSDTRCRAVIITVICDFSNF